MLKRSLFINKLFFITFFISLPLLTSCTSHQKHTPSQLGKNTVSFVYIQNNDAMVPKKIQEKTQTYRQNNWEITASIIEKTAKPRVDFYDFTISSSSKKFTITDINYKYGSYGKWRIIEKKKYLNHLSTNSSKTNHSITIKRFPITVKKVEIPHNQLLQLTFSTNDSTTNPPSGNNTTEYINLIFGIQKCIAKSTREFVCF